MGARADVEIRRMEMREGAAVLRLIEEGLAERWGGYDPQHNPDLIDFPARYAGADVLVAVEQEAGRIVGCGVLTEEGPAVGRIVRMSVAEDHRRRGVGRALVDALIACARSRRMRGIVVETTADWESAIALYRSRGFVPTRRIEDEQYFWMSLMAE